MKNYAKYKGEVYYVWYNNPSGITEISKTGDYGKLLDGIEVLESELDFKDPFGFSKMPLLPDSEIVDVKGMGWVQNGVFAIKIWDGYICDTEVFETELEAMAFCQHANTPTKIKNGNDGGYSTIGDSDKLTYGTARWSIHRQD